MPRPVKSICVNSSVTVLLLSRVDSSNLLCRTLFLHARLWFMDVALKIWKAVVKQTKKTKANQYVCWKSLVLANHSFFSLPFLFFNLAEFTDLTVASWHAMQTQPSSSCFVSCMNRKEVVTPACSSQTR